MTHGFHALRPNPMTNVSCMTHDSAIFGYYIKPNTIQIDLLHVSWLMSHDIGCYCRKSELQYIRPNLRKLGGGSNQTPNVKERKNYTLKPHKDIIIP